MESVPFLPLFMPYIETVDFPGVAVSCDRNDNLSIKQTASAKNSLTILQRIANADKSAASEFLETHGKLIWMLARKNTESTEAAEAVAKEIFLDVWRNAERFNPNLHDETTFILLVVQQRLKIAFRAQAATLEKSEIL
jgi:hypothetical protein